MTKIFDTLTTKLADLKQVRRDTDTAIEHVERYLRMGASWVNEREAEMAEMFAHLFPAAYAEPVVDSPPVPKQVPAEPDVVGTIVPLVVNGYQSTPTEDNPTGFLTDRRVGTERRLEDDEAFIHNERVKQRRRSPAQA